MLIKCWRIHHINKQGISLTLLDVRLLGFIVQELVQFLLIGIAELGEVELSLCRVHRGAKKKKVI